MPGPARPPRVLAFAYACEPGAGSEPGAGWGVVRSVAEFARCVVLVSSEHMEAIRRWQAEHEEPRLTFVEVPEPRWSGLAKHHRVTWFPLYLLWLRRAYCIARRLHAEQPFDAVQHVTYSTFWLPTPAVRLGVPCVWGPVGGAATTPRRLWPLLGVRGMVGELLDLVAVRALSLLPATRRTWRRAAVRLVQNTATRRRLPRGIRETAVLLNHALFADVPPLSPRPRGRRLLLVSALQARKGVALALHALARTPDDVALTIVGEGPERRALERLARRLRIQHRVEFRGRIPRSDVFPLYAEAAAVVFTGLREEGGIALAEAMLCGAPVIVLANGGAETIAAAATDPSCVALIQPASIAETARRMAEAMTRFSRASHERSGGALLDQRAARRTLRRAYGQSVPGSALQVSAPPDPAAAPRCRAVPPGRRARGTLVCVLIPACNAERYLRQAMDSALGQSVRDLQLIVVDDGSTDATLGIARSVRDDRVHVLTGPNGGRADARTRGFVASAPSRYVALLDADDLWDSEKLERQIDYLEHHADTAAVGCFMRYISSLGRVLGETGQCITEADLWRIAQGDLMPFPISSVLVRRDAFAAIGGFDATLREGEDLDFLARLARYGRIACIPEVLGSYRIHPESAMARHRLLIKMYARFVRERLAAADAGETLTWTQYAAAYQPTWRERHEDLTELWYRSAALWYGEGKLLRALSYGALAALASPAYTLRRLRRQRMGAASHRR